MAAVVVSAAAFAGCSWLYSKIRHREQLQASLQAGSNDLVARALEVSKASVTGMATAWSISLPDPLDSPEDFVFDCFEIASQVLNLVNPLAAASDVSDFWNKAQSAPGLITIPAGTNPAPVPRAGMIAVLDYKTVAIVQQVEDGDLYIDSASEKRIAASAVKVGFIDVGSAQAITRPPPPPAAPTPTKVSKGVIVWADDHPGNNSALAAMFRQVGYQVDAVLNTSEALAHLERGRSAAVISDMTRDTPRAGLDLLIKVRSTGVRLPFYVYTTPTEVQQWKDR